MDETANNSGAKPGSGGLRIDMPEDNDINGKEKEFCLEYYRTGNATQAARYAGFGSARANGSGYNLLKEIRIQLYIKAISKVHEEYAEFHRQQFVDGIRMIVSTSIRDFLGDKWDTLKPLSEIPEEKMHAVREMTTTDYFSADGKLLRTRTQLKLVDKSKYMDMLAKINNYYEGHNSRTLKVEVRVGNKSLTGS